MPTQMKKLSTLVGLNVFAFALGLLALGEIDPAWKGETPPQKVAQVSSMTVTAAMPTAGAIGR